MLGRRTLRLALVPFFIACGHEVLERADGTGSALLPNGNVYELQHDGASYRLIAEWFGRQGQDLAVDTTSFEPLWPIVDPKPSVLNRVGTPVIFGRLGYYHTGFDVIRSSETLGTDVLAPHDGLAAVFDWDGNKISAVVNPQTTVLAIYDPASHVVTQLMHIRPNDAIVQASGPVAVTRGQVVGQLVPAPLSTPADATRFSHTHLNFIDGANLRILDPAPLFSAYLDTTPPKVKAVKVAGEDAKMNAKFVSGPTDIVVEAFDRDEHSGRNLEISAIAFTVKDQDGNELASLPRCELIHVIDSLRDPGSFRATQLIDFGSAQSQAGTGGWPQSDVGNVNRTFRYAITHLAVGKDGRCFVKDDADGYLELTDAMSKLTLDLTLWDAKGNETSTGDEPITIERVPGSVRPDAGADASAP